MARRKTVTLEKHKLDALVSENIRLRSAANKIWLKWWLMPLLLVVTFLAGFVGAMAGTSW